MAKVKVNPNTTARVVNIEIERVVVENKEGVEVVMSMDDARVLVAILGGVRGITPGPIGAADRLLSALSRAGVDKSTISVRGGVYLDV